MKISKPIKYISPVIIALLSFLIYIILYKPGLTSEDFTTAILVFFAMLGSCAIILFQTRETRLLFRLYLLLSLIPPVIFLFFVEIAPVNMPLHPIILGAMIVGFVFGNYVISDHFRRKRKKKE
jgi:Na+/proline symporter